MYPNKHLRMIPFIASAIGAVCLCLPATALAATDSVSNAPIKITFDSNGAKNIWKKTYKGELVENKQVKVTHAYDGEITIPRYIEVPGITSPGATGTDKDGKSLRDLRFCFVKTDCTSTGYWGFKAYKPGQIKDEAGVGDSKGNPTVRCIKPGTTYSSPREFRKAAGLKNETSVTLYALWNLATFNVHLNANGADQQISIHQPRSLHSEQKIGNINRNLSPTFTTLTRSGYTLSSWNTKQDGSGKSYSPNEKIALTPDDVKRSQVKTNEDYTTQAEQPDAEVIEAPQDYMDYLAANAYDKKTKKGLFNKSFPVAQGGVAFKHDGVIHYCQLFVPSYAPAEKASEWFRDGTGKTGYRACFSIYNTKTKKTFHALVNTYLGHGNSVDYDDETQRLVVSTVAPGQPVSSEKDKKLRLSVPAFREFKIEFDRNGSVRAVNLVGSKNNYPTAADGQVIENGTVTMKAFKFGKACNRTYTDKDGNTVHAIYDRGRTNTSMVEYRWNPSLNRYEAQKTITLKMSDEYKLKGTCAKNLNRGYTGSLTAMMIQGASIRNKLLYFTGQAGHGSAILAAFSFSGNLVFTRAIAGGEKGIREIESISEVVVNDNTNACNWYLFSAYHSAGKVHVLKCRQNVCSYSLYAQWKPDKTHDSKNMNGKQGANQNS